MQMKIFIVTDGEYSDYSICSVWSTKEKADEMVRIKRLDEYSSARVEEYEVDPTEYVEKEGIRVMISMGTGEMIMELEDRFMGKTHKYPHPDVFVSPGTWYHVENNTIESIHLTEELALKAARDFRAKKIAEQNNL
jgi:hypothetical protein